MNPGLVWLLRKAPRAFVRSLGRRSTGAKKWLLIVGGFFLLLVVGGGQIPELLANARDPEAAARKLHVARVAGPVVLTAMLLLIDLSGRGLYFRPAEIDFLFPAPVSRRDLLLYQVLTRAGISALSGLWTAVFVVKWAGTLLGGLAASVLAMVFLQLASQTGSLVLAALGERAAPRVRLAVWLSVAALLAVGAKTALAAIPEGATGGEAFAAFAGSPFVLVATAPTQPFAQLFAASSWVHVLAWGAACAAELAAMAWIVLRLDVTFEEAALASSRKIQERLARMRSGEGAFAPATGRARKRRVPMLPRLGGAGPVAWRQLLELVRNPASVLWTAGSLLLCGALIVGIGSRHEGRAMEGASYAAAGMAIGLTTFANQGFTFDFRRDLDRMAEWKRLPIRPVALAAGQLVAPMLVFTVIQGLALSMVFIFGRLPVWAPLVALAVLPPWNWLSAAFDNALFLLFPFRIVPEDPAKVPFIGRMLLSMMLKSVAVGIVALVVGIPCVIGAAIGGPALVAGCIVGWLVLVAIAGAATFLTGWTYSRFDVSRDV